jgi:hypothetical protein
MERKEIRLSKTTFFSMKTEGNNVDGIILYITKVSPLELLPLGILSRKGQAPPMQSREPSQVG